jgi:hypothetical protein
MTLSYLSIMSQHIFALYKKKKRVITIHFNKTTKHTNIYLPTKMFRQWNHYIFSILILLTFTSTSVYGVSCSYNRMFAVTII